MEQELIELKAELERVKINMESLQQASISFQSSSPKENILKKELGLQNLIQPWGGLNDEDDVNTFLRHVDLVASTGCWTEQEKMLICRSKLTGPAKACVASYPELLEPTARFDQMAIILRKRFEGFCKPEQRLLQLNSVEQLPGEGVREYADRCRRLGELATPKSLSVEEASWARVHYENIVMAAFIKGLRPDIRRQLQFDPPSTFEGAVNKASRVGEALADDSPVQEVWAIRRDQSSNDRMDQRPPRHETKCYRCYKTGHFARECPRPRPAKTQSERDFKQSGCFVCGSKGHFARACPRRATTTAVNASEEFEKLNSPKATGSMCAPTS